MADTDGIEVVLSDGRVKRLSASSLLNPRPIRLCPLWPPDRFGRFGCVLYEFKGRTDFAGRPIYE
jgi:hypothetical protein